MARSTITDLDVGGVLRIASVTSTALATVKDAVATAHGRTTITGVTVAGAPAVIDDHGLHIGSSDQPLDPGLADAASRALAQTGLTVYVSKPTSRVNGAHVTYTSGSVVVYWKPPGDTNGDSFTVAVGGVSVGAGSSPGFGAPGIIPLALTAGAGAGAISSAVAAPVASGSMASAAPAPDANAPVRRSVGGGPTASVLSPTVATVPARGVSTTWTVLALLAAALVTSGLSRVPEPLLRRGGSSCPMSGDRR
jgi:hypothetical protein